MSFDPNKPFEVLDDESGFDPSKPFKTLGDISGTESLVRGAGQGATLGFAEELLAGAKSIYDDESSAFTGDYKGLKVELAGRGMAPNNEATGQPYRDNRDAERAKFEAAEAANPGLYTTGEITGAMGSSFLAGMGALNAAKGAKAGAVIGKGALQGGAYGLG